MATWKTVCELARELPLAELSQLHGAPAWRVNGKVIAQVGPRLRVPNEDEIVRANGELMMVLVDPHERAALMQEDPDTYFMTPHYEGSRLVLVWLRRATKAQLRELLIDAWRARLSKTQLRQYGDG